MPTHRNDALATLHFDVPAEALEQIAQRAAELLAEKLSAAPASPYLTPAEAAEYLRCTSKQRIYDLVHQGALVPRRDGARLLLSRDQLDAYVHGRETA